MAEKLNTKLLESVKALLNEKIAFVPMPGGDPSMGGGMPPPGGDPSMGGGMPPPGAAPMDPSMGGMPPPGGDPSMGGGMPPPGMDPAAMGGMPPPPPAPPAPAPAPAPGEGGGSMITMSSDEFLKFVKQIVALCTSNKFGADPKPTDGGPVSDGQAAMNAKIDAILNAIQG